MEINKKIIRIFMIIFIFIILFTKVYNLKAYSIKQNESNYEYSYSIIPDFINDRYNKNQIISLEYNLLNFKNKVVNITYNEIGFKVNRMYEDNCIIYIDLLYDSSSEKPFFSINIYLENNDILESYLYGFINNEYLFVSTNSYQCAEDLYYSYAIDNNIMSENEYEFIITKLDKLLYKENKQQPRLVKYLNTYIRGIFEWEDDWGNKHPLIDTKVSINKYINNTEIEIVNLYTDSQGKYSYYIENIEVNSYVYIKVKPQGINSIVKTGGNNDYIWANKPIEIIANSTIVEINKVFNMRNEDEVVNGEGGDENLGRAFQISQAIISAEKFTNDMTNNLLRQQELNVEVIYPSTLSSGCFYSKMTNKIHIGGNNNNNKVSIDGEKLQTYSSWDVIQHEFFHLIQSKMGFLDYIGGWHTDTQNMYDHYISHYEDKLSGNCINRDGQITCANPNQQDCKEQACKITYSESLADILGCLSQYYSITRGYLDENIKTIGDSSYVSYNGSYTDYDDPNEMGSECVEKTIKNILWDIYSEDDSLTDYIKIGLGFQEFWNLTMESKSKTLMELINNYYLSYNSCEDINEMGKLLEYYNISPKNVVCDEEFVSHISPTFKWRNNGISENYKYQEFSINIYNEDFSKEIIYLSNSNTITLTTDDWKNILEWQGRKFYIRVVGNYIDTTQFYGYGTSYIELLKPTFITVDDEDGYKIIDYLYISENLIVPNTINNNSITSIGSYAFQNCEINSISFPNCLRNIGDYAFNGCANISNIELSYQVNYLGDGAFKMCSSLHNIVIRKARGNIIELGNNVFYGCDENLIITVPQNRIGEYMNSKDWKNYKDRIVPDNLLFEEIKLDCYTSDNRSIEIESGCKKIYKININCSKSYKIKATSNSDILINLYDSEMNLITLDVNEIQGYLKKGTYYVDFEFLNSSSFGNVAINFSLTWPIEYHNIDLGVTNVLEHLHLNDNNEYKAYYSLSISEANEFYRFILSGINSDETVSSVLNGTIKVYDNNLRTTLMKSYTMLDENKYAVNQLNQNELLVFIPNDITKVYIEITLPTNDFKSYKLTTYKILSSTEDLFEYKENEDDVLMSIVGKEIETYFIKINLKQTGKFALITNGFTTGKFVIMKRQILSNNEIFFEYIEYDDICELSNYSIILEEGIYYIGYHNVNLNYIGLRLERKVTSYGSNYLEPDPTDVMEVGTEITLNGGEYNSNVITQGFTRLIFLSTWESRTSYYWYSSDETVLRVTDYGTVLGLNVDTDTNVKVMAVNINNPSKVYVKEFIVKKDLKTYEENPITYNLEMEISEDSNEYSQINLGSINVPINWLQYYEWTSSNNKISVDSFGIIYINNVTIGDVYTITGNYILNSRVRINILLRII